MASTTNNQDQDGSNKKRKTTGIDALAVVLGKQNTDELQALRKEVKELRILEALQIKAAVTEGKDIHYWFDKVNDPNDETSIKTLKEMRDYILENSVEVDTLEFGRYGPCRFSTIGGCHELMASIVWGCRHYAFVRGPGPNWQWDRSFGPICLCHHQCLNHIQRWKRSDIAKHPNHYEHIKDFPTVLVEAKAKGEDPTPIAERRRTLRNMGGFHF